MKYVTHDMKGCFKYIKKQTIFEIIKTVFLYLMALGIFFIGYYTLGTKKSLWSVIAVLGLLPASKAMVGAIMFLRFRSISSDLFNEIRDAAGNLPVLYENILTTSQKTYMVPAICYCKGSLCLLYEGDVASVKKIETHLNDVLKKGGYKGISVKVFSTKNDFVNRLLDMNSHFELNEKSNYQELFNTIKAVSL